MTFVTDDIKSFCYHYDGTAVTKTADTVYDPYINILICINIDFNVNICFRRRMFQSPCLQVKLPWQLMTHQLPHQYQPVILQPPSR